MKKFTLVAAASSALLLTACGGGAEEATTEEVAATTEEATEAACDQDGMMAKAEELATKMQGMASDPEAMQEMAAKLTEIQEKVTAGTADGSYSIQDACAAYDELLAV